MTETTTYDAVISLGNACAPAGNIRVYFGDDRAFPFDWWITSRVGVEKVIRADFKGLFQRENLVVVPPPDNSVRDRKFNLYYHHDFRDAATDKYIAPDWESRIPTRLQRLEALADRMNRICNTGRVLFVRQERRGGADWDASPEAATERAVAWLAMFREKWPNGRADLLTLDSGPEIAAPLTIPEGGQAMFDNVPVIPDDNFWKSRGFAEVFRRWGFAVSTPRKNNLRFSFTMDEAANQPVGRAKHQ